MSSRYSDLSTEQKIDRILMVLEGFNDQPGLVSRVAHLEKQYQNHEKMLWKVTGGLVVIGLLVDFVTRH